MVGQIANLFLPFRAQEWRNRRSGVSACPAWHCSVTLLCYHPPRLRLLQALPWIQGMCHQPALHLHTSANVRICFRNLTALKIASMLVGGSKTPILYHVSGQNKIFNNYLSYRNIYVFSSFSCVLYCIILMHPENSLGTVLFIIKTSVAVW